MWRTPQRLDTGAYDTTCLLNGEGRQEGGEGDEGDGGEGARLLPQIKSNIGGPSKIQFSIFIPEHVKTKNVQNAKWSRFESVPCRRLHSRKCLWESLGVRRGLGRISTRCPGQVVVGRRVHLFHDFTFGGASGNCRACDLDGCGSLTAALFCTR